MLGLSNGVKEVFWNLKGGARKNEKVSHHKFNCFCFYNRPGF